MYSGTRRDENLANFKSYPGNSLSDLSCYRRIISTRKKEGF